MKKIAFLVPVYPPHFKYAKDLINSWKLNHFNEQSDLWFIFTNEDEKKDFPEWKHSLILPQELRCFKHNGIINIKKFWGLSQLKDKSYDYIIVVDAETLFVKEVDLAYLCNKYYKNKVLLGNQTSKDVSAIKRACKKFFKKQNIKNDDLYLWGNQPCIYCVKYLDDFFNKTKLLPKLSKLRWTDFDYYIYMYYLIIYKNFIIKDIGVMTEYTVAESSIELSHIKRDFSSLNLMMCAKDAFQYFDNPDLFLFIHLDRDIYWSLYQYKLDLNLALKRIEYLESTILNIKTKDKKSKLYKFFHFYWLRNK